MREFRNRRLQRAIEYSLLIALHLFFLLSFRAFYSWWMAAGLGLATFGMNFRLTQLRERRRAEGQRSRSRMIADTFESVLFVCFIVLLSTGGYVRDWLGVSDQEYLAYIAAILFSLFLSGFLGETWWQIRRLPFLEVDQQQNYISNLQRTIIFPYLARRRRK